jgi:glycosyltransferase involved in cell wall biosynthesis
VVKLFMLATSAFDGRDLPVRITHLSTYDLSGGAGRSAYRLHKSLRSLGHESRLLVYEKQSADASTVQFVPLFDAKTRLRRGFRRRFIERTQGALESRPVGSSYFTDDRTQYGGDMLSQALPTDVLHLHWIARFIGYTDFFRRLPAGLPLVWTLHDMNPFTGGCHHAADCRSFQERCGRCPQLSSSNPSDFSSAIWKRKRRSYARLNPNHIRVVTPSRWLAEEARRSSLMGSFQIGVIPYGVDTESFQPQERGRVRELLGISQSARVLLFAAPWLEDKYKGAPILLEALGSLKTIPDLRLLTIGHGEISRNCPIPVISLGPITDEGRLSSAYSAADLCILPTLQDNFPNTALEALACGLPVVGSMIGGVPEIVREGHTGTLVERGNARALASAIDRLLRQPDFCREMSANCRRVAIEEYGLEIQARRYVELYDSLLSRCS